MPSYILYYFNGRGRAEICRMLFVAAGVMYTDKRFEFNEWDRYRNDMPTYTVPVLEIDNRHKMPETMAIVRYLAREYGFYGKSNMDMFRIDYIADCFYEIMHDYMRYYHWKNGNFRYEMGGDMVSDLGMSSAISSGETADNTQALRDRYLDTCDRILPFLERTLEMRHKGHQFFMGDQMTICDMMCYGCLENPMMEDYTMFNNYPKLMALRSRVAGHPKIAVYLQSRSRTNW